MSEMTQVQYSAEETLARLLRIVERGRLKQGNYALMGEEREPDAPCGGTNCCMIGATWLANGVRYENEWNEWREGFQLELPNVSQSQRAEILMDRPALSRALNALNLAATERMSVIESEAHTSGLPSYLGTYPSRDAVETLFESRYARDLEHDELHAMMREVVVRAQEILKAS